MFGQNGHECVARVMFRSLLEQEPRLVLLHSTLLGSLPWSVSTEVATYVTSQAEQGGVVKPGGLRGGGVVSSSNYSKYYVDLHCCAPRKEG